MKIKSNLKPFPFIIIIMFHIFAYVASAQDSLKTAPVDTIAIKPVTKDTTAKKPAISDSTAIKTASNDTTAAKQEKDTIPPNIPLYRHGSLTLIPLAPYCEIKKQDIQFVNYTSLGDIVNEFLPAYPLNLGAFGQFYNFSFFGGTPRDVAFNFNGRNMNDPEYGSLNFEQIPPEFMEKAEILVGSDAIVMANNSSGALVNIQEIRYNTSKPFTRLWFSQAGSDYVAADALLSQNFMKNWNFTTGFRRMSAGGRYSNSNFDIWNIRALLRWNYSPLTNFSITEQFTNHGTSLNGGLDALNSLDLNDELSAVPNYTSLNERQFRHDLTFSMSSYLSEDSSKAVSGSAYFSHIEWNRDRPSTLYLNLADSSHHYLYTNSFFGAEGKYEQNLGNFLIVRCGGNMEYLTMPGSLYTQDWRGMNFAGFGQIQINFAENLSLSGGYRLYSEYDHVAHNIGASLKYRISDKWNFLADLSRSERVPTPSENINLSKEASILGIFQIKWKSDIASAAALVFSRYITSPVITEGVYDASNILANTKSHTGDSRQVYGGALFFSTIIFKHINVSAWVHSSISLTNNVDDKRFPLLYAGMKLYYNLDIGMSILNLGVNFTCMSDKNGEYYFPLTRTYLSYGEKSLFSNNGIDGFAEARLGNAFLRLTYQNLLSQLYYYVPVYPQLDRNLRLTVSWSFFD